MTAEKRKKTPTKMPPPRPSKLEKHADEVFELIAEGGYINDIAAHFDVGRSTLFDWLGKNRERWDAAKVASAESLVQQSLEILDEPEAVASSAHASMARARSEGRRWLAGVRSKEYAPPAAQTQVNVGVGIGSLHLDALRAHGHRGQAELTTEDAEFEILGEAPRDRRRAPEKGLGDLPDEPRSLRPNTS